MQDRARLPRGADLDGSAGATAREDDAEVDALQLGVLLRHPAQAAAQRREPSHAGALGPRRREAARQLLAVRHRKERGARRALPGRALEADAVVRQAGLALREAQVLVRAVKGSLLPDLGRGVIG